MQVMWLCMYVACSLMQHGTVALLPSEGMLRHPAEAGCVLHRGRLSAMWSHGASAAWTR